MTKLVFRIHRFSKMFLLLLGPVASLMIDNLSCRTTVVLSGVCFVVGYMATAFAPNIYIAILTCGFVAGVNFSYLCKKNVLINFLISLD